MEIRWLGHASFALTYDGTTVLVDPFLTGNPVATESADDIAADTILLTHGHEDHLGDTVAIAKRTGAKVQAITEIAGELSGDGIDAVDTNIGGTASFDWGTSRLVPAFHTSTTPKGTVTPAAGLVIEMGGKRIYIVGDSGLFSDMALPGKRGKIDIAIVPIGGHYTMDRFDAVVACEFIGADVVIPSHYNTFPVVQADAQAFKSDVQNAGFAQVVVLAPGETYTA